MKKAIAAAFLLLPLAFFVWSFTADDRFSRESAEMARSMAAQTGGVPAAAGGLKVLPEPVKRFLDFSGVPGRKPITYAKITHGGSFRPEDGGNWVGAGGTFYFSVLKPSFLWSARLALFPGIYNSIRESYTDGIGAIVNAGAPLYEPRTHSGAELTEACFMDYFTGLALMPTSLLPSAHLRWENAGPDSARLLFNDLGREGAVIVKFNQDGSMDSMTGLRYHGSGNDARFQRWTCRYANYIDVDGMKVPGYLESSWNLPDGQVKYRDVPYSKVMIKGVFYGY